MCCVIWIGTVVFDLASATMRATCADGSPIIKTRHCTFDTRNVGDYPAGRIAFIPVHESGTDLSQAKLELLADVERSARPAVATREDERLGWFVRLESTEGAGITVHLSFAWMRSGSDHA
jgi:hypothetical protein